MKLAYGIIVLMLAAVTLSQAQVAVIVNKSVPVSSANASTVKDLITLSSKAWSNGTQVVVFSNKSEASFEKLCGFVGVSTGDLKKTWMRIQLAGEGKAPSSLGSDADMIKSVSSTPGAIGFVSASSVTGDVKVIATIN